MGGYIYLICDPSIDAFKIGVTRNIKSNRIKNLQTGNPAKLHIVKTYKSDYPFRLEKMLHAKFLSKRILNEWFELDTNDIINFTKTCDEITETINCLIDNPFFAKGIK